MRVSRRRALIGRAVSAGALSGCTSFRSVNEFALFQASFIVARATSEAVFDRLAVAEREIWPACVNFDTAATALTDCQRLTSGRTPLEAGHAPCPVDVVDPPATESFRRAMSATMAYTEALLARAEFRDRPEASAPQKRAALQGVRGGTGTIVAVFVAQSQIADSPGQGPTAADIARLAENRRLLALPVVMLDATCAALDAAVAAARNDSVGAAIRPEPR